MDLLSQLYNPSYYSIICFTIVFHYGSKPLLRNSIFSIVLTVSIIAIYGVFALYVSGEKRGIDAVHSAGSGLLSLSTLKILPHYV